MRILKYLLLLGLLGGLLAGAVGAWAVWHYSRDLPSTEGLRDLRLQVPLRVYTRDGELIGEFGAERREPLDYEDIPPDLIRAFLAAEDDRFFEHPGVDYQGLLRAAWVLLLTGEKAQGGSTITMQLARNLFLSSEKSYIRKFREILLALQMEQELTKEEILRFYLNKIFLGHRAYGIGAAAKVYYDAELSELSLAQLAMIAGLPKAPSRYNPISGPQRALLRRNYVLRRMRKLDYISEAQYQDALDEPISARLRRAIIDAEAHYVAEYARGRIINQYGIEAYTSGIRIITTLDSARQEAATQAVRANLLEYDERYEFRGAEDRLGQLGPDLAALPAAEIRELLGSLLEEISSIGGLQPAIVLAADAEAVKVFSQAGGLQVFAVAEQPWSNATEALPALQPGDLVRVRPEGDGWRLSQVPRAQGALVALDPENGAVRAMVGGFDFFASKFNRAMQAQRQPGSAFKPFVYSAALENDFTPATIINDAPVVFDDPALGGAWRPENYSGRFLGPTPLREGLVRSSNLVAIRLLDAMGIDTVREYVTQFGFPRDRLPRDLSMALGTGVFSPLEMARGFAVFANGGYLVEPYLIEEVRGPEGEVLHRARPPTVCDARCRLERDALTPASTAEAVPTPSPAPERPRKIDLDVTDATPAPTPKPDDADTLSAPPPMAPRAISAANAYVVTSMMRDVIQRGTGRRARTLGRDDLAGKTGTTNDQRDAWFCGFNAGHVAVGWVGHDDISPLGSRETGSRAALPMWIRYMDKALDDTPSQILPQPPGVVSARINPATGELAAYGDPQAQFEIFIEGRLPESGSDDGYAVDESGEPASGQSEEELIEDLF